MQSIFNKIEDKEWDEHDVNDQYYLECIRKEQMNIVPHLFETQLKITDSRYKRWRRLILDWRNLKNIQKQLVVAQVTQEFRKIGRGSELLVPLTDMLKDRNYVNSDIAAPPKDVSNDAIAAAATAALANKLSTPVGAQNLGTGIGALAAYWASRRA
jgi:hypothetical protein